MTDISSKLTLEFPIYRKPTKKLNQLVEKLAQLSIGSINHDEENHLLTFSSFNSSQVFTITDSYIKNPKTGEVEFKRFCDFRSALNFIIAVTSCDKTTRIEISLNDVSMERTVVDGVRASLTLTIFFNSFEQFKHITDHLALLNLA